MALLPSLHSISQNPGLAGLTSYGSPGFKLVYGLFGHHTLDFYPDQRKGAVLYQNSVFSPDLTSQEGIIVKVSRWKNIMSIPESLIILRWNKLKCAQYIG
jgi:hypothetical protein